MRYLIIGNGPAAVAAAEAIRGHDRDGALTMVSREPWPFYSPCPLAEVIEASVPREHLFLRPAGFYDALGVQTHFGRAAVRLDAGLRRVALSGAGGTGWIEYDRLLIACGAAAVMPPIPGLRGTPGVFALKTLDDMDGILARLPSAQRALVIGSGFIGLEAAQALARRGLKVTVAEARDRVLPQMLDDEMSGHVEARLRSHGIEVRTGASVQEVLGAGGGVVGAIVDGQRLDAELVVCAAGVRPDLHWLADSGLALQHGILVDDGMRTNLEGVYAAGDVIEAADVGGVRRVVPNWPNAVNTGRVAGLAMAGIQRRFRGLDAVNVVRIFDVPVASFGQQDGDTELRHEEGAVLRKLSLRQGRIVGAQFFGDVDGCGLLLELMNRRQHLGADAQALLRPGAGLGRWLAKPPAAWRWAA